MNELKWIDSTTHSRWDKERKPRILNLALTKRWTLVVHRHIHDESTWFMTIHNTHVDMVNLRTDDLEIAKSKAIEYAINYMKEHVNELQNSIFMLEQLKNSEPEEYV